MFSSRQHLLEKGPVAWDAAADGSDSRDVFYLRISYVKCGQCFTNLPKLHSGCPTVPERLMCFSLYWTSFIQVTWCKSPGTYFFPPFHVCETSELTERHAGESTGRWLAIRRYQLELGIDVSLRKTFLSATLLSVLFLCLTGDCLWVRSLFDCTGPFSLALVQAPGRHALSSRPPLLSANDSSYNCRE